MGNPHPALQAAQVLVGFTTSTHSLFNSLLLTHQQEWGTALLRLAEFPGAGPASPWGSESMPGGPRADQSQSTVGGHHQSVKKIRIRMQETEGIQGCGDRKDCEERTGRWRRTPQPGSPCSDPEDTRSSLPPPAGLRGTQQDAREPLPGRPRPAVPRLPLSTHPQTRSSLRGQLVRGGGGTCWVICWRLDHQMASAGSLHRNEVTDTFPSNGGVPSRPRGSSAPDARQHLPTRPVSSVHNSAVD